MKYRINKELRKYNLFRIPFGIPIIYLSRIPQSIILKFTRIPKDIKRNVYVLKNGLKVETFEPKDDNIKRPCLIYFHGGAFGYKADGYHKKLACTYAKNVGIKVVFPDYRLLPKHGYNEQKEDAITTFKWVYQNAEQLRIIPDKIAVGGDSAGATITTYLVSATNNYHLCAQMLIYPATDAKMQRESMKKFSDTPLWNSKNNAKMWNLYLNKLTEFEKKEASPIDAKLPSYIPNTYIEVAEFDCLHDEGIEYYKLLKDNGARVLLNETHGTIHGYDRVLRSAYTKDSIAKRINFLKENLNAEVKDER